MAIFKGEEGRWITTEKGSRVFIKNGQSLKEALKERFGDSDYENDLDEVSDNYEDYLTNRNITSLKDLPKAPKNQSHKEIIDKIYNRNRQYEILDNTRENNCQKTTACIEMQFRGIDAIPAPFNPYFYEDADGKIVRKNNDKDKNLSWYQFFGVKDVIKEGTRLGYPIGSLKFQLDNSEIVYWRNSDIRNIANTYDKMYIEAHLRKFPNSRWIVKLSWKGKNAGSHVINAIVDDNGKATFIDGQLKNGKPSYKDTWDVISYRDKSNVNTIMVRVDNRDINESMLNTYIYDKEKESNEY